MKKLIILLAMVIGLVVSGCAFDDWARTDDSPMNKAQFKKDYDGFKGCKFWSIYGKGSNWGLSFIPLNIQPNLGGFQGDRLDQCMQEKGYRASER